MATPPPRDHRRMLEQTYGIDPAPTSAARPKRVEPRRYRAIAQPSNAQPIPEVDRPVLRLVGTDAEPTARKSEVTQPIKDATDPRWVLAVRTSEQLQGTILTPEARHRLMRLGRILGLNPFDTSLIIAIVQDQARRGVSREQCPAAGRDQLQMVPLRPITGASIVASLKRINVWQLTAFLGAAIVVELIVLKLIFGS